MGMGAEMAEDAGGTLVEKLRILLDLDTEGLVQGQQEAAHSLTELERSTMKVSNAFKMVGTGAAAFAGVAIKQTAELAQQVKYLQTVVGGSAQDISKTIYTWEKFGIEADDISESFASLGEHIAANDDSYKALGIRLTDAKGQMIPVGDAMDKIAEKLRAIPDDATKAAILTNIFGDIGTRLVPVFDQGADGLHKLGEEAERTGMVLDQKTVNSAANLGKTMSMLQNEAKGLAVGVGSVLIPELASLAKVGASTFGALANTPGLHSTIAVVARLGVAFLGYRLAVTALTRVGIVGWLASMRTALTVTGVSLVKGQAQLTTYQATMLRMRTTAMAFGSALKGAAVMAAGMAAVGGVMGAVKGDLGTDAGGRVASAYQGALGMLGAGGLTNGDEIKSLNATAATRNAQAKANEDLLASYRQGTINLTEFRVQRKAINAALAQDGNASGDALTGAAKTALDSYNATLDANKKAAADAKVELAAYHDAVGKGQSTEEAAKTATDAVAASHTKLGAAAKQSAADQLAAAKAAQAAKDSLAATALEAANAVDLFGAAPKTTEAIKHEAVTGKVKVAVPTYDEAGVRSGTEYIEKDKTVRKAYTEQRSVAVSPDKMLANANANVDYLRDNQNALSSINRQLGGHMSAQFSEQLLKMDQAAPGTLQNLARSNAGNTLRAMQSAYNSLLRIEIRAAVERQQLIDDAVTARRMVNARSSQSKVDAAAAAQAKRDAAGMKAGTASLIQVRGGSDPMFRRAGTHMSVAFGATGGIVNRPTLAVIGEAGPEAVVPVSRSGRLDQQAGVDALGQGRGGIVLHQHYTVTGEEKAADLAAFGMAQARNQFMGV